MPTPSITTVNQPKHDMGFMACTQLLSMIANPKKETQKLILDTELVLRESTNFQKPVILSTKKGLSVNTDFCPLTLKKEIAL
ncbi:MAG: substrate-binding domain-containing protein [Lachnospiraceae bacterium]